ncbi:MAG: TraB/GumN family protein [Bacteroidetes bacterium]|nr:TraB/GumN family protein [Bacteroidota bacterium]
MKYLKYNFRLITLLTFVLLGCSSIYTQSNASTSLLWEVSPKSNPSKVAYLLGSIHIATPDIYPLNPVIMECWNKCDALAVEINIADFDSSSLTESMMEFMFKIISFTGEKLSDKLPPDLYERVKEKIMAIEDMPITEDIIDMFTPLGIAALLQLEDLGKYLSLSEYNEVDGIDKYFLNLATENNTPIYELESISLQLEAVFAMFEPLENDINSYLEGVLDDTQNTDMDLGFEELLTAWKNGDADAIDKIMNTPSPNITNEQYKAMMNTLLYNRNINMAKKIEEYLTNDGTYFIVVGAGHYVGKKSIIDILQQTGKYNIKRL